MNKILNYIKNNKLELYISINIFYLIIMCLMFATKITSTFLLYSRTLIGLFIVNSIIVIVNHKKYKSHIIDIPLVMYIITLIISTIFAYNIKVSLFGLDLRNEGLFTMLYYLSLFYLCGYCKNKKIIIFSILITGYIQFLWGVFQYTESFGIKYVEFLDQKLITGLATNPNYYGAYMLLCICLSIGLYIKEKEKIVSIFYLLLACCYMSGILFSNTLSCLVGLFVSLLVLLIYSIKNKNVIKYILLVISLLSVFFIMSMKHQTTMLFDIVRTKNEAIEISKGNTKDTYGSDRIYIWQNTIKHIPKYLVHGIGIDNFAYIDDGKVISKAYEDITFNYDKAHNDYLQMLVTVGIFGLISIMLIHIISIINGIKNNNIIFLLPTIGYIIHLIFSVSVIEVSPIFYICMGLLIDRDNSKNNLYKKYIKRIIDILFSIIVLIILFPINLITIILIKIFDKGSIIFKQERTTLYGKKFYIYKYKTMKNNKITRLGRILRITSIDEIPQFINVLKGDMSLIGPRPWITNYYDNLNNYQKKRNDVRPGIIGLAQVNGRNKLSINDKINFDIYYVNNISFMLDLKILFSVFKVLFIKDDVVDMDKYIENEINNLKNNKEDKLEVLLSIKKLNKKKLNNMNITSNCTIIVNNNKKSYEKYNNFNIYSFKEKDISILNYLDGDIILLCKNNTKYIDNYENIVLNEFKKNPMADIIIFNCDSNSRIKKYNNLNADFVAFKVKRIKEKNIRFNSSYVDNSYDIDELFIIDSLKNKLKVYGVDINIGNIKK